MLRPTRKWLIATSLTQFINHLYLRMPDVFNVPFTFFLEVIFFKLKDDEHPVDASLHHFYPVLLPRPDLGTDVVDHFQSLLLRPLGDAEIEAGIIDKDE